MPEEVPASFLPSKLPWEMRKSNAESDNFYASTLPRKPELVFSVNISAIMADWLANAIVEGDKIFLANHQGIYALNRDNGTLIWGVEVYSDTLEGRSVSHPQPVTKWRALGLWRFVEAYGVGKYLFVGTSSTPGGEGDAYLLALNKENGELVWKVKLESEANASSRSAVTSNLIVAEGKVYVGSVRDEGYVFCVSEDGNFIWRNKVGANVRGLAYGDGVLFVTSEPSKKLYALNAKTGAIIWVFEHDAMLNAPSYRNGKIILSDSQGNLLALSKDGKLLWKKFLGVSGDVNNDPYIAVSDRSIYAVRGLGEGPLNLLILDFDGNVAGNFTMASDERGGKPVASRDVVILPAVKERGGSKIYLLWRGSQKLSEFEFPSGDGWIPTLSVAYSEIYVASPNVLYKLSDTEKPKISSVEVKLANETLIFNVKAYDEGSALYKVLLVYSLNNSPWNYTEMEISRRYVMEPIGGYGLAEEDYTARVEVKPGLTVEFYIVAVDNSGNYETSKVYAYRISK
ncbi:MAG: PQQ-binding-like beta-propeller repeat protein [Archaeoglobaceae archaeon]